MGRAPCCNKVGLKRGRWTAEEDELLSKYITTNGEGSWRSLPKNAGLLRCGKSCRLRWINYLRADLKRGNISKEEEETIAKLHAAMGSRWSQIASHLPGRTDNEIKNYWNSHLSRRIHTIRRIGGDCSQVVVDIGLPIAKRRAGRTSRSAMKKSFVNSSFWRERRATTGVLPTSSSMQSSQDSSMMQSNLTMHGPDGDLLKQVETDLLSPTQFIDGELWATNDDMVGGFFGPSEGSSVGWGSNEESLGAMHDGPTLAMKEGVVGLREEEASDTLDNRSNWDLEMEEMASRLWDEEGEVMPWLWESGDYGELEMGGMEERGSQEESFESWVL